jgi:hypothetical protein
MPLFRRSAEPVIVLVVLAGLASTAALHAAPGAGALVPAGAAALAVVQGLPTEDLPRGVDAWTAHGEGRHLIDDFESPAWPAAEVWALVADLTGPSDWEYLWASTQCRAASGNGSLWSVGGGADGSQLTCGASYAAAQQSAAVLALDLSALHSMSRADLVFDVWADAAPDEGLFVNYVEFDTSGNMVTRRTVYSATGRVSTWYRDARIDLTRLRDALDGSWGLDLRGRTAYLEILFVSVGATPGGEGIFLDNLALDVEARPPVVVTSVAPTSTPPATERTTACTTEPDCRTLIVEVYDDFRCDGRYRAGLDFPVRGPVHLDVTAGNARLSTDVGVSRTAYLRLPMAAGAEVRLTHPDGYVACAGSPNPRQIRLSDFGGKTYARVTFSLTTR